MTEFTSIFAWFIVAIFIDLKQSDQLPDHFRFSDFEQATACLKPCFFR